MYRYIIDHHKNAFNALPRYDYESTLKNIINSGPILEECKSLSIYAYTLLWVFADFDMSDQPRDSKEIEKDIIY